jgi:hypothetical protein
VNGYRRLNYVAYFGRDPTIATILRRYEWVADIGEYALYQRVAEDAPPAVDPPSAAPGTRDVIRADTGGVHLRLGDPTFALAVGVFLVALAWCARREIRWER